MLLFLLALSPLALAFYPQVRTRGWLLVGVGNAVLVLTLFLPAIAGAQLLMGATELLGEGVRVSNPRLLPSAALVLGLVGGYVVLFGGLRDLLQGGVKRAARIFSAWVGVLLIAVLFIAGAFDIYSVVVEFSTRGDQLGRRTVEHTMFVAVALAVGLVLGVGLGLWAHRDERIAPVVLYTVGIIQTVPSLALFGILLVPLARLGDRQALSVGLFFLLALALAGALIALYRRAAETLPGRIRQLLLLVSALAAAVPLALFVVVLASFLFRSGLLAFTSAAEPFGALRLGLLVALLVALGLWLGSRTLPPGASKRTLRYGALAACGVFGLLLAGTLTQASSLFLSRVPNLGALTIRDLGVSGIGTAPAVIALTLYSLLPLVRNTYAGLNNVDPAVTDSGRGMGMNAAQRFTQLELPIALPIIIAGVRNAAVALVGIGAVATVIGAGGLGDFILGGIINTSVDQILLGAVPAVLLAVLLDALLRGLERLVVSPGIRQLQD